MICVSHSRNNCLRLMCLSQGVIGFIFYLWILTLAPLCPFFLKRKHLFCTLATWRYSKSLLLYVTEGKEGRLWLRKEAGRGCRCLLHWYKTHHPPLSRQRLPNWLSSATWYSLQTVQLLMYLLSCKCPVSLSVSVLDNSLISFLFALSFSGSFTNSFSSWLGVTLKEKMKD